MSKQNNIYDFLQEISLTLKNITYYPNESGNVELIVNPGDKINLLLNEYENINEDILYKKLHCQITGTKEGKYVDKTLTFSDTLLQYEHLEDFEDNIIIKIYKINENDEIEYSSDYTVKYEKINPQSFNSIIETLIENKD